MRGSPLRVGIVGCGRMGSTIDDEVQDYPAVLLPYAHVAGYAEVSECQVVAAADINPEALARFGQRWGVDRLYNDYRQMLARERLDIVSVTTRATERAEVIRDAVAAGVRAIFAEKAIACSLREADEIVALVERSGVVLAVNCSRRWHPYFMKAEEMVRSGQIGRVLHVYGAGPGAMSHTGSHILDVMRMFAGGDALWVMGHTDPQKAATDDDIGGNGYIQFESGVTGFYHALNSRQVEFDVVGERGRIRTYNNGINWEFDVFSDRRGMLVRHTFPRPSRVVSPTVGAIRDIVRCLKEGGTPRCSARDGRAALEIAIAVRESERRGGVRVTLPLADRSLSIISR